MANQETGKYFLPILTFLQQYIIVLYKIYAKQQWNKYKLQSQNDSFSQNTKKISTDLLSSTRKKAINQD